MGAAPNPEAIGRLRSAFVASESRFRAVIEHSADVTVICDRECRLLWVSASSEAISGYTAEELVGSVGFDFVHPDDEPAVRAFLGATTSTKAPQRTEPFRARQKDGSWRVLEMTGVNLLDDPAVRGVVLAIRDLTVQHELQVRLRQSERLEAVGQLAGGIAHDFNNVLLVIRGYTSVLRSAIDDPQLRADVEEVAKAAERAAELTRQLLAFSRRQVMLPTLLDLRDVVVEMQELLTRSIPENIELHVDVRHSVPMVLADRSQMEQVLLNLVVNARDAMPDGGRIDVGVAPALLHRTANVSPPLPAGDYVALSVGDTGDGIGEEDMARIFEPFFTTKATGVGTGLGLSTAYGIVVQSGGAIEVTALPSGGTRMTVLLPASQEAADEEEGEPVAMRVPAGSETILLVEDEDAVRDLVRRVLEDAGYRVLAAARPSEAQRLASAHEVDLLLTDVVMPEMSGYDLSTRVRLAQPKARTLFMSGYAHKALGEAAELPQGELLRKPFSPEDLTAAVRAVLDGGTV
jgi:two-component system, cell cycle sensor histidine kinase and response regulator CckA